MSHSRVIRRATLQVLEKLVHLVAIFIINCTLLASHRILSVDFDLTLLELLVNPHELVRDATAYEPATHRNRGFVGYDLEVLVAEIFFGETVDRLD